ncbi:MAG: DUF4920 domain-containing protein [Candidatus Marinimicrobia bacterium]|nr:DUF4920 domain-containing protein [Candidatus Neomarinimicrobiota bacterium]MCF7839672.1 DUF4920 domain-containing protein [Candidatus Neomarinimicrobiota bacterium]MCF7903272.1 DUF4920 domain-containing protein [Candidatus Neomarinimicrobiota bacterium]
MKKIIVLAMSSAFVLLGCSQSDDAVAGKVFGNGVTLEKTVQVHEVLSQADALKGKTLRMRGMVASVCQDEGCKIEMVDGNRVITIRFKDDAFRAPKDAVGQTVEVEGVFLASSGEIKCADMAAGKECDEEQKAKDAVFASSGGGCCAGGAERVNYNFIASGMVLL